MRYSFRPPEADCLIEIRYSVNVTMEKHYRFIGAGSASYIAATLFFDTVCWRSTCKIICLRIVLSLNSNYRDQSSINQ